MGFATFAELTYQALRNHGAQCRLEQKTFDAKIEKARHRRRRGFGVKGGQDQMAGQRRVDGDMGCFRIAHLADHDHIRILTHEGAQSTRESQSDRRLDL